MLLNTIFSRLKLTLQYKTQCESTIALKSIIFQCYFKLQWIGSEILYNYIFGVLNLCRSEYFTAIYSYCYYLASDLWKPCERAISSLLVVVFNGLFTSYAKTYGRIWSSSYQRCFNSLMPDWHPQI